MEAQYSDSLTGTPVGAVMQSAAGGSVSGVEGMTLDHLKGVLGNWAREAEQVLADTLK